MEKSVSPALLAEIAAEFFEEFERHVFDCENRYGEIAPQQEKALEALGFELPFPVQKPGKMNNRKKTLDAACREMLFDICRNHSLHLDREPEYGGRAYLEKQDFILMRQKEMLAVQDQQLSQKQGYLYQSGDCEKYRCICRPLPLNMLILQ